MCRRGREEEGGGAWRWGSYSGRGGMGSQAPWGSEKHIGVPSRSQEERIGLHLLGWFRFQFDKQSMNFASGLAGVRRRLAPSCLTRFVLPLRGLPVRPREDRLAAPEIGRASCRERG